MTIHISDGGFNTVIFIVLFILISFISLRKKAIQEIFPIELTNELKGFAILTILFGHIGYFLTDDHQFLFPLSILSGVGVNLFLFLSGAGLTLSNLKKNYATLTFYKKRLQNLFFSLWITLIVFIALDFLILNRTYSSQEIIQSFLGFFTGANPTYNINSPLWFITLILFYYLIFPLVWVKKIPILSPILIFIISYLVIHITSPVSLDNIKLYSLHLLAFPLGMSCAILISYEKVKLWLEKVLSQNWLKLLLIIPILLIFIYTAYYSQVGQGIIPEQLTSLITMFSIIFIFILNNFTSRFLSLVGIYSYEIYLIHWPILSRFDFLYKTFPAWIATAGYLILFLIIGYLLQKLDHKISNLVKIN